MTVGTYLPWEPTATLWSGAVGSAARGASAPTEGGEGRGHTVAAARLQLVHFYVERFSFQLYFSLFSCPFPCHVGYSSSFGRTLNIEYRIVSWQAAVVIYTGNG